MSMKAWTIAASISVIAITGLGITANHAAASAFTTASDAVEYRQKAFSLIRENFAYMSGMVRGERDYDADAFKQRAQALYHLSYIPFEAFSGAGENVTANSDALPVIWENWSDFEAKRDTFQAAVKELVNAAASENMREIRPKFMDTARGCQQCHQGYRAD
ncbi:c-type cytochrome [Aliidiomarina indica]|uniref:c-type cytochrome n=1 Tax=Aliidiomarina indica TaxID=2749147 RepID=UPI00188DCE39|nr:cytochrome c [Aliidiomarina indica]